MCERPRVRGSASDANETNQGGSLIRTKNHEARVKILGLSGLEAKVSGRCVSVGKSGYYEIAKFESEFALRTKRATSHPRRSIHEVSHSKNAAEAKLAQM